MAHVVNDSTQRSTTSTRRAPGTDPSPFLRSLTLRPAAKAQPVSGVGVIGTGEMSAAIAERLVDAGFPVTLHGASSELLDEGLARLEARLDARVRNGELTRAERNRRAQLVCPTCWYIAMSSVDVVIICDDECEDSASAVFAALDRVMKRGAILATTATSSGVGKFSSATRRRGDVVGIRFSRFGHELRLVDIERDAGTSDDVVATLTSPGKALDRTPA
jgi:3-hydroxyacyl-CoA dehydrogenase